MSVKEKCEQAVRQELLKELKGKLVSRDSPFGCCYLSDKGKYRVKDVEVYFNWGCDCNGFSEYIAINVIVIAETLKAKQERRFDYDITT